MTRVVCPTCGRPFPSTLTAARLERGWSMHDLAREAGVTVATVSRVESGRAPSIVSAFRIARALSMTVDDLWSDYGKDTER